MVWGGSLLESTCFDRLKLLQDKIVFNLFALPCHSANDISSIYNRAGILKLEDLYRVMTSTLMFNILFEDSIPFLKRRFDDLIRTHNYETRGANDLVNPFPTVKAIKLNFVYRATKVWNELDDFYKTSSSALCLKRNLSRDIINLY